jgi:hypothetical protein
MAADPTLIQSDILSRVATSAQKKYIKDKLPKVDRKTRPYMDSCESIDDPYVPTGEDGAISDAVSTTPDLGGQWWSMLDSIQSPVDINNKIRFEVGYARFVTPVRIIHDEWLRKGYVIQPHSSTPIETRMRLLGEEALLKLRDILSDFLESHNESHERSIDLALHRQGTSAKEPIGLNGHLPIAVNAGIGGGTGGNWLGLNRTNETAIQHYVGFGTVGGSGTFIASLRNLLREMKQRVARSGLSGEWEIWAGSGWLNAYHDEIVRLGIQRNTDASGVKKVDYIISDDALNVGGLRPQWNPTQDTMDTVASSERGIAASAAVVTFSGGTPTRAASAYAITNATGGLAALVITDRGAGYASAPTVAVTGLTLGTLTLTPRIYSTGSGGTLVTVNSDDSRLGQVADVVLGGTNNSSGLTVGDVVNFTNRAYFIFKPAKKYRTVKGIKRALSIPADPRAQRLSELQLETAMTHYIRAPRLCAVHYWK